MRSESLAILGAVALHGAILVVAHAMPPMSELLPASKDDTRPATEYDIEPALLAESRAIQPILPTDPTSPDRPVDPVRQPEARTAGRTSTAQPPSPQGPQGPSTAEPGPPGNPPPGNAGPDKPKWDDLPPDQRDVLGVPGTPGGAPLWTMPGVINTERQASAAAPTTTPAAREVDPHVGDHVLNEVMQSRDKGMGIDLPAGGTAASVVASVVRSSDIPDVAKGTIEIRLGPNGTVLGVRVLSSLGGSAEQWNRVAQAAKAALMGRGLIMTGAYEKGATVTVNVSSNLQAPSGSKGGFTGTGAAFDTANIGAHSTRNVRTSFSVAAAR